MVKLGGLVPPWGRVMVHPGGGGGRRHRMSSRVRWVGWLASVVWSILVITGSYHLVATREGWGVGAHGEGGGLGGVVSWSILAIMGEEVWGRLLL